jgi:hypothetical protein
MLPLQAAEPNFLPTSRKAAENFTTQPQSRQKKLFISRPKIAAYQGGKLKFLRIAKLL